MSVMRPDVTAGPMLRNLKAENVAALSLLSGLAVPFAAGLAAGAAASGETGEPRTQAAVIANKKRFMACGPG